MDIAEILTELRTERASIDGAIAAIESLGSAVRRWGKARAATAPKRGRFSAATRKRIAAAQRARWAKWRKKKAA